MIDSALTVTREPRRTLNSSSTTLGGSSSSPHPIGAAVKLAEVLDVFEGLFNAAKHPDIVSVARYGSDTQPGGQSPAGVNVKHGSGSEAYLWGAVSRNDAIPVPVPDVLPQPRLRAPRMAIFAVQLLDAARPEQFKAWRLLAFPDLGAEPGVTPLGVEVVCGDGTKMLLRATAGSGPTGDPADDPAPDYKIPEEVKDWHLQASAASAAPR